MTAPFTHIGVMTVEVVTGLNPRAGAIYLDGTFGRGGWTRALLAAAPCTVIAIDHAGPVWRHGPAAGRARHHPTGRNRP